MPRKRHIIALPTISKPQMFTKIKATMTIARTEK